jgi:hypothetical protein
VSAFCPASNSPSNLSAVACRSPPQHFPITSKPGRAPKLVDPARVERASATGIFCINGKALCNLSLFNYTTEWFEDCGKCATLAMIQAPQLGQPSTNRDDGRAGASCRRAR